MSDSLATPSSRGPQTRPQDAKAASACAGLRNLRAPHPFRLEHPPSGGAAPRAGAAISNPYERRSIMADRNRYNRSGRYQGGRDDRSWREQEEQFSSDERMQPDYAQGYGYQMSEPFGGSYGQR